ncbi:MAG: hypothetical protein SGJ05_03985 [bacterium]|nr:hypothetical protein [bacterium]
MAKVQFRITYSIPDGKRGDYLQAISKLREYYGGAGVEYGVFESKGRHNHFQEVYVYPSQEAYDASDDPETITEISGAIDKIYSLAKDITYDVSSQVD